MLFDKILFGELSSRPQEIKLFFANPRVKNFPIKIENGISIPGFFFQLEQISIPASPLKMAPA